MRNEDVVYKTYEETHREWIRVKAGKILRERGCSVDMWVLVILGLIVGCIVTLMLSGCQVEAKNLTVSQLPDEKATAISTAIHPKLNEIDQILATLDSGEYVRAEQKATKIPVLTVEDIVPQGYYDSPCTIPKGVSLNSYLTDYKWVDPYQAYGWDCSQMAANIEWLVENCGYEANLVATTESSEFDHIWVEIKIGNKWRPYEATSGSFYFGPEILQEIYEGNTEKLPLVAS